MAHTFNARERSSSQPAAMDVRAVVPAASFENENVKIRVFHAWDSQRVQCSNKFAEMSNTAHNVRRRTWQDYTYHRPAMGFHR
jgi:hypothetical protein